jgi:hypothetical protein
MKYFIVKNDIIKTDSEGNPTWTDEPLWLRQEIDTWKGVYGVGVGGGRFYTIDSARYSVIISPNESLMSLSNGDLREITAEECEDYVKQAFPERTISNEDGTVEVIPSPTLEKISSIYWHYATNHTGTISTSETWSASANDHHMTGTVTIGANVILTWEPGTIVYNDGGFFLIPTAGTSGVTTFNCAGTPSSPILHEGNGSRLGTGGSTQWLSNIPNNCNINLQYLKLNAPSKLLQYTNNPTNTTITMNNLYVRDILTAVLDLNNLNNNLTISNAHFERCATNSTSVGFITMGAASSGSGSVTLNNCYLSIAPIIRQSSGIIGAYTINFNDCFLNSCNFSQSPVPDYIYNYNRCNLLAYTSFQTGTNTATKTTTVNDTLIHHQAAGYIALATSINANNFNNCDIVNSAAATVYALTNSNITGGNTVTATNCYMAGHRTADYRNFYTGSETPAQVSGTIAISAGRTTPNFPMTATGVSVSNVTANSAIISWTTQFATYTRVRYGISPSVYTMSNEVYGTWSNYDGKGILTKTPSIPLQNLKSGTVYYYVCDNYDWAYDVWVTSVEYNFSTLVDQPSYGYIG